jgi:NAD(P)-dependent dehydrogenase (short-subunit alcohol dehydrogenase family)
MSNNIAGKVIVITGASSGLGEAAARHLAAQGATVVLGARRADRIQALANELVGRGGKALAIMTDVTNRDQVKKLVDTAVQQFGRIDVLINNAGLMPHSPLERLKTDEWDRMIDVNIKGVLYGRPPRWSQSKLLNFFSPNRSQPAVGRFCGTAPSRARPRLAGHGRSSCRTAPAGDRQSLSSRR